MERAAELLMPAGSLEKLKVAILYGADAVYMGTLRKGCQLDASPRLPAVPPRPRTFASRSRLRHSYKKKLSLRWGTSGRQGSFAREPLHDRSGCRCVGE